MWQSEVIAVLRDCKDHGWEFRDAWELALKRYPPRGPGMGQRQMTLEEDGEPSLVQFLERVCRDAWYGVHPEAACLNADLMERDGARFARRNTAHAVHW